MKALSSIAPFCRSLRWRAVHSALAFVCVLGVWLALPVAQAGATVSHNPEGSFNASETPSEFFGYLLALAVDDSKGTSAGDVYVGGYSFATGPYVYKFTEGGKYTAVELKGSETPAGSFSFLDFSTYEFSRGLAVDGSKGVHKGDVYVADAEHHVIDRFNEEGKFICEITGKEYSSLSTVEQAHECAGATGSKTPQDGFTPSGLYSFKSLGVAVNPVNGDVYVSDPGDDVIDEFNETGEFVGQITSSHLTAPGSLALNSTGELYVTNGSFFGGENVVKFDASGNFVSVLDERGPEYVAVDPSNDRVFVAETSEQQTAEYDSSDKLISTFGKEQSGEVGVSGSTGRIYVSSVFAGAIYMYGKAIVGPNVTTGEATAVEETSATLHGEAEPDLAHGGGEVTSCQFEYGPTKGYGQTAPCEPAPPYSGPQDVSARIEGLRPQSIYHYRLEAEDSEGAARGEDRTLTTPGPPTVDRVAAEALRTSVRFWAKVNPWGHDTICEVQYVSDASFNESKWAHATSLPCEPADLGSGFGSSEFPYPQDVVVWAKADGLPRSAGYHYRFLATSEAGIAGRQGTFETFGIHRLSFEAFKSSQEIANGTGGVIWKPGESESPLQAGAHPYELVTTIEFSHTDVIHKCESEHSCPGGQIGEEIVEGNATEQNVKDFTLELPPGLIGNPSALPKCSHYLSLIRECPTNTLVGELEYLTDDPLNKYEDGFVAPSDEEQIAGGCGSYCLMPLYNLEPSGPHPAEFGSEESGLPSLLPFDVRSGVDYGVTSNTVKIIAASPLQWIRVRIWGVPANPGHEASRNIKGCPMSERPCKSTGPEVALLTNPTNCTSRQTMSARADTWAEQGQYVSATTELERIAGCGELKFDPSLEAQPTSTVADSPTGLHVDLKVPQDLNKEGKEEPRSLATSDLKAAAVTFPAGLTVNPSSADGLQACSEQQVGFAGFKELRPAAEPGVQTAQFTPGPAECPDASKLGSVEIDTQLLEHPLLGAMYLATPQTNPFGTLMAVYLTAYDPITGVVIKLPGKITADPATGQLTTTFDQSPQLPFEELKVDLFEGSRASLTTPFTCGSYSTTTDLTSWSAPEVADATPSSMPFAIATAPGGGACASSEAQASNAPGFEAGTASPVADAFSPFALHLKREDGSQRFRGLDVTLPPGLIGKIAGLEECSPAAIGTALARSHEGEGALELAHPSCPAGSQVGIVHVGAGSGAPFFVTGRAYFAGPYEGAPFSLVIVTPVIAGPFDLGTVVVRAALFIDPYTAQVTVKSDPFPTILDGIPLDIRRINVDMNRNEFTLNPTSCYAMRVTGREYSTAGQSAALSDRFQVGGCTALPFHPSFVASSSGITSRREGASLVVHVASSMGQANIAEVKVSLPKQLPTRQETLKFACPESVFAANPASCPAGSAIGTAVARTPILSNPLTGPVYIVSHGGAAFPDVEVVLQGEGVTIILDGKTDIKKGITTSTFATIPDAPVSSFEMRLPRGPHSVLAAPRGLCLTRTVLVKRRVAVKVRQHGHVRKRRVMRRVRKRIAVRLAMATLIRGQNGAVIHRRTPIKVTGCSGMAVRQHKTKSHGKRSKHPKHKKTSKANGT